MFQQQAADSNPALFKFQQVREHSVSLINNLSEEDCQLQAMADVSPMKWHLAHTSWFFEAFVLSPFDSSYDYFAEGFDQLFNSYYNGIGKQFPRAQRGLLSRPSLAQVLQYRAYVDKAVASLLLKHPSQHISDLIELGLEHEKQHQELMLMDIKYNFSVNPLFPAYLNEQQDKPSPVNDKPEFIEFDRAIETIGADNSGFSYDNERPMHEVIVGKFALSSQLVTKGEYLAFIEAGGYQQPTFWHSDGWAHIQNTHTSAPLYWHKIANKWYEFDLDGLKPLNLNSPLTHISYFEASAYAVWANARLPTEFEWERAAKSDQADALFNLYDTCWQWTNSAYLPYPGFKPFEGVAGEYNGKFMSNQMVLRGGCGFTSEAHTRVSYRNFFYPHQSWMQSGIRLAKDSV